MLGRGVSWAIQSAAGWATQRLPRSQPPPLLPVLITRFRALCPQLRQPQNCSLPPTPLWPPHTRSLHGETHTRHHAQTHTHSTPVPRRRLPSLSPPTLPSAYLVMCFRLGFGCWPSLVETQTNNPSLYTYTRHHKHRPNQPRSLPSLRCLFCLFEFIFCGLFYCCFFLRVRVSFLLRRRLSSTPPPPFLPVSAQTTQGWPPAGAHRRRRRRPFSPFATWQRLRATIIDEESSLPPIPSAFFLFLPRSSGPASLFCGVRVLCGVVLLKHKQHDLCCFPPTTPPTTFLCFPKTIAL